MQARENFGQAIIAQRTAIILEQHKKPSEIINVQLGSIPDDSMIETEFELVMLLRSRTSIQKIGTEASVWTLIIPTCNASRYESPSTDVRHIVPPDVLEGLFINIEVIQSPELQNLSPMSQTHEICRPEEGTRDQIVFSAAELPIDTATTRNNAYQVLKTCLKDGIRFFDRDFMLDIRSQLSAGEPKAQAWLEKHPELSNHQALMITMPPSLVLSRSIKSTRDTTEVILLIDQSGFMEDKIYALKAMVAYLLQRIPAGWKFNVWRFGSTYSSLWTQPREKKEETLSEALSWIYDRCPGNMGGTELVNALNDAVRRRDVSCPAQVIVFTDGQVWRVNDAMDIIMGTRQTSDNPICFSCLGLGNTVKSHTLQVIQGLASAGGGYSEVINMSTARIQGRWQQQLDALLTSILTIETDPILFGSVTNPGSCASVSERAFHVEFTTGGQNLCAYRCRVPIFSPRSKEPNFGISDGRRGRHGGRGARTYCGQRRHRSSQSCCPGTSCRP